MGEESGRCLPFEPVDVVAPCGSPARMGSDGGSDGAEPEYVVHEERIIVMGRRPGGGPVAR